MNRFISVTINGVKNLISIDEIRAVGVHKSSGKTLLFLDFTGPDNAIEVDQTVDQIEMELNRVSAYGLHWFPAPPGMPRTINGGPISREKR